MVKAVIFDVDGVLLDSKVSNWKFFDALFKKFGYPGMTLEQYEAVHHCTMHDVIVRTTGLTDELKVEEMLLYGMQPFSADREYPPMPAGAPEVIKLLSEKYQLGIVTSRTKAHIFEGPEFGALEKYFKTAVGYQDTKNHKPHPEPILLCVEKLGVKPEECVYIGDAPTDILAANAAGMPTIIYNTKTLEGAKFTTSNFAEIPGLVAKL